MTGCLTSTCSDETFFRKAACGSHPTTKNSRFASFFSAVATAGRCWYLSNSSRFTTAFARLRIQGGGSQTNLLTPVSSIDGESERRNRSGLDVVGDEAALPGQAYGTDRARQPAHTWEHPEGSTRRAPVNPGPAVSRRMSSGSPSDSLLEPPYQRFGLSSAGGTASVGRRDTTPSTARTAVASPWRASSTVGTG